MSAFYTRKVFDLRLSTGPVVINLFLRLKGDIAAVLSLHRNSKAVLYLTPGAYARIWDVLPQIPDSHFYIDDNSDKIGQVSGFECRGTPASLHKNFYGMSDYEFCYQIERN
jgi:hypothetical protein